MAETLPPHEGSGDGGYRLSRREKETSAELRYLDPQLSYLYEQGLLLASRLDEPGAAPNLAYCGRELSRGVLQRVLDDEGIDLADLEDPVDPTTLRDELGRALGLAAEDSLLEFVLRLACEAPRQIVERSLTDLGVPISKELERVFRTGRDRVKIAHALGLPTDDPRVDSWFRLPAAFARWEKYRLGGPPPDDVRRAFETLSDLLFGLVAPYYVTEAELDELLALEEPSQRDVRRLQGLQLRPVQRAYFFGKLEDPRWIEPLHLAGLFSSPPDRKVNADGSWSARAWPEGEYLSRVAAEAPESAAAVLESLPDDNENPVVWDVLARAASQMPSDLAAHLVPRLTRGLCTPGARFFSESVVELVVTLAEAEQVEAFELADYLLFVESPAAIEGRDDLSYRRNTRWVFPRLGWHDQRELLRKLMSALEGLDAERALRLLLSKIERLRVLTDALEVTSRWLVWGLDIRGQSDRDDIISSIIGESSDLAGRIAQRDHEQARRVMAIIESFDGDVFERIGHRVLAAAGHHLKDRLDKLIASDAAVHVGHPAREIALVLRQQFTHASSDARGRFADAVARGPDRSELRESLRELGGEPLTEEEVEYAAQWQRRRLTWFRGDIPEELSDLAETLGILGRKPSFREQALAEVGIHTEAGSGWGEARSPAISADELSALSPSEVVRFLAEWKPDSGRESAHDLHASLSQFASKQPEGALAVLELAGEVAPLQLESLLRGLLEATKARSELDWTRVLAVVGEAFSHAGAVNDLQTQDASEWRSALSVGFELIREGCRMNSMPVEAFPKLWEILRDVTDMRLVWDLAERQIPEKFEDVFLGGFHDASGHLVRSVVSAALRHYRAGLPDGESSEESRERARGPVREALVPLLNRVLTEDGPNSPFAQAVLGEFIPQLQLLVPQWVRENEQSLFAGGLDDPISRPGWSAYINGARLYDPVFVQLRPWYLEAAGCAREWTEAAGDPQGRRSVGEKLAVHLIVAVLRGLITPQDEDGLLQAAFANMKASEWGHAYWVVFRSWSDEDHPPPIAAVKHLVRFWEWRLTELEAEADGQTSVEEAKELGWLFHTPYMLNADVIRLGQATARLAKGKLEMYSRWDRMLELSTSDPDGAFEIAEAVFLAELRTEFPHVPSDVGPFLKYVLKDGGKETRQRARRLVHKLGERGFREFKDLLEEDIAPSIGILAFGSLRDDPGEEIEAVLVERRPVETPFPVEFARYSKSRGGAPTLVPVEDAGATVPAEVLVLKEGVSQTDAQSLLWRREARRAGSGEYERPKVPGPNHVLVEERHDVAGVGVVFYTDFAQVGKVPDAAPEQLARHAIASVGKAESEKDGITYLIKAQAAGTVTPKTEAYEAEVLHQTGAGTLEEALAKTRSGDNPG